MKMSDVKVGMRFSSTNNQSTTSQAVIITLIKGAK